MSPEMANLFLKMMKKKEIDYSTDLVSYSTDLYTIGILAIELLYGCPPFGYFKKSTDHLEDYLINIVENSDT